MQEIQKRVRAVFKTYPPNKFGERNEEMIQFLEVLVEKRIKILWWTWTTHRWVEIDREIVPSAIWMQASILGSTDWKSKWNGMPGVVWLKKQNQ